MRSNEKALRSLPRRPSLLELAFAATLAVFLTSPVAARASSYTQLSRDIGYFSQPLSSDGSTVVYSGNRLRNGAMEALPQPAGKNGIVYAQVCSADGSVVAGYWKAKDAKGKPIGDALPFRWAGEASLTLLPLPAGFRGASPSFISADGEVVGGAIFPTGASDSGWFRWTAATGMVKISPPEGSIIQQFFFSADGHSAIGTARFPRQVGDRTFRDRLFHWTSADGSELIALPAGVAYTGLSAAASDALTASGEYRDSRLSGSATFLWTLAGGFTHLAENEYLEPYPLRFRAFSADGSTAIGAHTFGYRWLNGAAEKIPIAFPELISRDGSVVLGRDRLGQVLLWTAEHGAMRFTDLLEADLAAESSLAYRNGISVVQLARNGNEVAIVTLSKTSVGATGPTGFLARLTLGAAAPDRFAGTIFEPIGGVKSSATLKESYTEVAGPTSTGSTSTGEVVTVTLPLVRFTSTAKITVPLNNLDLTTVTTDTELAVNFGTFDFSRKLSQANDYFSGATKATFNLSNPEDLVTGELVASWSPKSLTLKVTLAAREAEPFSAEIAGFFTALKNFADFGGQRSESWSDYPEPLGVAFAGRSGRTYLLTSGRQALVSEDDFVVYSASARFDASLPTFKVLSPAPRTVVVTPEAPVIVRVSGPLRDITEIQARVNGGAWLTAGYAIPDPTLPAPAPYYEPVVNDLRANLPLNPGDNLIEVRSVDDRGRTSPIVAIPVKHARQAGNFFGMVHDSAGAITGTIRLSIMASGTVTGVFDAGGQRHQLKGTLATDGTVAFSLKAGAGVIVPLVIAITSGEAGSTALATVDFGTGKLTASLSRQYPFSAAVLPAQAYAASGYNILFPKDASLAEGTAPRGTGFATLVVARKATTRLVGKLADGTSFSHGGMLDENGAIAVFLRPYQRGKGVFAGVLAFEGIAGESNVGGDFQWMKPTMARTVYPGGFTAQVHATGSGFFDFADLSFPAPADGSQTNSRIIFSGGGLSAPLTVPTSSGYMPAATPENLRFTVNAVTGLRTGTFFDTATSKKRTFYVLPQTILNRGEGFFLGEVEGGLVQLLPSP